MFEHVPRRTTQEVSSIADYVMLAETPRIKKIPKGIELGHNRNVLSWVEFVM
jgi:hypothetical protein